ncbi:hypothetical protein V5799_009776, partial [Amblyomma americanum]
MLEANMTEPTAQIEHTKLVTEDAAYSNPKVIVGLSYQFGVLAYRLPTAPSDPAGIPNAMCDGMALTSLDTICEKGQPEPIDKSAGQSTTKKAHGVTGFLTDDKTIAYLSETRGTFASMLMDLQGRNITFRDRIA